MAGTSMSEEETTDTVTSIGSVKTRPTKSITSNPLLEITAELLERLNFDSLSVRSREPSTASGSDSTESSKPVPLLTNSLQPVLKQELLRYRDLLSTIHDNLAVVRAAVAGEVPMSPDIEASCKRLADGEVPAPWLCKSYLTKKKLTAYVADLEKRLQFMQLWQQQGPPPVMWFSALFAPHSYLTGLRQHFARILHTAIDNVDFKFRVTSVEVADIISQALRNFNGEPIDKAALWSAGETGGGDRPISTAVTSGVHVWGFFLEGARWDRAKGCIAELDSTCMHDVLPVVTILPDVIRQPELQADVAAVDAAVPELGARQAADSSSGTVANWNSIDENHARSSYKLYRCPVYRTSDRRGDLSTMGYCSNYVFDIILPGGEEPPQTWVVRGVAALTQLDD